MSAPLQPHSAKGRPVALTIAGFDPSTGAGITADLQVFAAHGLFGTSCITALTVQSTLGVAAVHPVPQYIGPTLEHLTADLPPAGIKIGMLGSAAAVVAVAKFLRNNVGPQVPVVLDPVILSSSGASLLGSDGLAALKRELLPIVTWITPNDAELTALAPAGTPEESMREMRAAYPQLNIVVTGGEGQGEQAVDVLLTSTGFLHSFSTERIATTSTHGTGCAFSSALLSRLILGSNPEKAVAAAKAYVTEALRSALGIGHGRGPLQLLPARLEAYDADPQHPAEWPSPKP